ncbi:17044_t:CDS:2, partial [Acaulospora morrowiae]
MTPPLPIECIEDIISNIVEDKDTLYSFLLVSRYWCKHVAPILWKRPFSLLGRPSALLIRTYIMCLSQESKHLLSSHKIDLNFANKCGVPYFDYATFLRVLDYRGLCYSIFQWLSLHQDYRFDKLVFLFARELCKLFMSRCSNFDGLYMDTRGMDTWELQMDYLLIPCLPGAEMCLAKLEHFTCGGNYNGSGMLCALSKVCKNIRRLDIYNSNNFEPMGGYLAMLVEAQKGLERFTLIGYYCLISDVVLALNTQSRSLTYVELTINDFFEDDLSLSSLAN